jgi:hypothetical protein
MMIPEAHVTHATTRRLRVKIPSMKGKGSHLAVVKEKFDGVPRIHSVEINPVTGSVLFLHTVDAGTIAAFARENNLFSLVELKPAPALFRRNMSDAFRGVSAGVRGISGGELDLWGTSVLVLLGAGVYQIAQGNFIAPAWYTAFWYAFNIFLKSESGKGTV